MFKISKIKISIITLIAVTVIIFISSIIYYFPSRELAIERLMPNKTLTSSKSAYTSGIEYSDVEDIVEVYDIENSKTELTWLFPIKSAVPEIESYFTLHINQFRRDRGGDFHSAADIYPTFNPDSNVNYLTTGYRPMDSVMIIAPYAGTIKAVRGPGTNTGEGDFGYVSLESDDGYFSRMGHVAMINPNLKVGDYVEVGTPLAIMGRSGLSSAKNIHLDWTLSQGAYILSGKASNNLNPFTAELLNYPSSGTGNYLKTQEDLETVKKSGSGNKVSWYFDPTVDKFITKDNKAFLSQTEDIDELNELRRGLPGDELFTMDFYNQYLFEEQIIQGPAGNKPEIEIYNGAVEGGKTALPQTDFSNIDWEAGINIGTQEYLKKRGGFK